MTTFRLHRDIVISQLRSVRQILFDANNDVEVDRYDVHLNTKILEDFIRQFERYHSTLKELREGDIEAFQAFLDRHTDFPGETLQKEVIDAFQAIKQTFIP